MLAVQQVAGNGAALRLLGARTPAAPSAVQRAPSTATTTAPVVQRAPYGLDRPTSQGPYVDVAYRLWTSNKRMTLKAFADALLTAIEAGLPAPKIPYFEWTFVTGAGAHGVFDSRSWKIKVNTSKFSTRTPAPTLLGQLTVDEVTEVVGTIYHEARHADQDVLIIRDLLAQKKKVSAIVAATKMPRRVVAAVAKARYPSVPDADQTAHARRMYDVMYGTHKQFLTFLVDHSDAIDVLGKVAEKKAPLRTLAPHVATLARWQSRDVKPHIARITRLAAPTAVETALRTRLERLDGALTAFTAVWKTASGAKKPSTAVVEAVREKATAAMAVIGETYLELEGEGDAFRVEEDVKDAFDRKLNP
ncbi:hypothetical protein [Cellulomonas cellasea]|uniref:Uncharacterized protein n=2 Tax=Cellulomonas cellasea TaxID=43670 RepID=A0A0A0BCC2_9CELL|nr:hypothetical protein [Cellulomonas cellasea]KGM03767.1 hypothetical protein Q760_13625 [Cellulomonas cellasea DSM 20118]GEA86886.1 hypothetical protein CCE01nite_08350 [Cellulomonas cellasea]